MATKKLTNEAIENNTNATNVGGNTKYMRNALIHGYNYVILNNSNNFIVAYTYGPVDADTIMAIYGNGYTQYEILALKPQLQSVFDEQNAKIEAQIAELQKRLNK